MRITLVLIAMLASTFSFAQMRQMHPIGKIYITEGIVLDRETLKVISSAILYNDSLGITTTSDENGYFKIVVPYDLVKDGRFIPIDIVKKDYKRNGSGLTFNPVQNDTYALYSDKTEYYDANVKVSYMAKNSSSLLSANGAHAPAKQGTHGAAMIQLTYDEIVSSERREKKFDRLKQGNEKVYFPLDDAIGLSTRLYDLIVFGKLSHIYIDGKKVKLTNINKEVKRSTIFYDQIKSDALSKSYGKGIVALRRTPPPGLSEERLNSNIKATLEIDLDN